MTFSQIYLIFVTRIRKVLYHRCAKVYRLDTLKHFSYFFSLAEDHSTKVLVSADVSFPRRNSLFFNFFSTLFFFNYKERTREIEAAAFYG